MEHNRRKMNKRLTTKRKLRNVSGMREIIIRRMKELDWTAYRLAKSVEGKMTAQTVYDFVAEPQRTKINDKFVGHLLDALGLKVVTNHSAPSGVTPSTLSLREGGMNV